MLWHRQAIFESKGDKLSSSAESRIRTQGLRYLFTSRLNACWQTDWAIEDQAKNLNSTARPYDQWAFSPLDPIVSWLSHLALAIYMFVVVNFDISTPSKTIVFGIIHWGRLYQWRENVIWKTWWIISYQVQMDVYNDVCVKCHKMHRTHSKCGAKYIFFNKVVIKTMHFCDSFLNMWWMSIKN